MEKVSAVKKGKAGFANKGHELRLGKPVGETRKSARKVPRDERGREVFRSYERKKQGPRTVHRKGGGRARPGKGGEGRREARVYRGDVIPLVN